MFDEEYEALYRKQLEEARGQRKEMLERDLSATKKMLEVLYPVLGSLAGITLEYEMVSLSGVKIYGDAYIHRIRSVLEEENFHTHAENITRNRFSFERARIRSVNAFGYAFYPYSKDELEQQPAVCREELQELFSLRLSGTGEDFLALRVFEREALRFAALRSEPFYIMELANWLLVKKIAASRIARGLVASGYFVKIGGSELRSHRFSISESGRSALIGKSVPYQRKSREGRYLP